MSQSYYFISAPADRTKQETISKFRARLGDLGELFPFALPEFKVCPQKIKITLSHFYLLNRKK